MKRADIERGLAAWSSRMTGTEQFAKHLAHRNKERADAARRAQESFAARKAPRSSSPVPALGGPRHASSAANPVAAGK